jgi:hypothetical protein
MVRAVYVAEVLIGLALGALGLIVVGRALLGMSHDPHGIFAFFGGILCSVLGSAFSIAGVMLRDRAPARFIAQAVVVVILVAAIWLYGVLKSA